MKSLLLILFSFIVISTYGQQEIKPGDVKNHEGDSIKVCGKVYGGKYLANVKGQPTLLDFGNNYPNAPLTLVIWDDTAKEFEKSPIEIYKNVEVCVTGKIELYKGRYQLVISHKSQVILAPH